MTKRDSHQVLIPFDFCPEGETYPVRATNDNLDRIPDDAYEGLLNQGFVGAPDADKAEAEEADEDDLEEGSSSDYDFTPADYDPDLEPVWPAEDDDEGWRALHVEVFDVTARPNAHTETVRIKVLDKMREEIDARE